MFLRALDQLEEWLIAFLMGGATLIIFAAVTHRFALDMSAKYHFTALYDALFSINMSWAQELCIYMFVWMAKFGAAYGVRTGIHVGVDVLVNRCKPRLRGRFIVFSLLAGAVFTGTIAALGAHFVWDNGMHYAVFHALGLDTGELPEGPITPDLEWPTWAVYSAIPLGSSLMCFRFLQVLWQFLKTGELPQHDESHVEGLDDAKTVQLDTNFYGMDDNLHMHDTLRREPNGHGTCVAHDSEKLLAGHPDETRNARFPLSSSLPQAGERDKVSLREFHDKPTEQEKK